MIDNFSGAYRFLSNFWPCTVELDDIVYPSSEHAYVAYKSLHIEVRKYVASIATAEQVKRFGRSIILRQDWEEVKDAIMARIVSAKFQQNQDLMKLLVATRPHELIEGNTWGDTYWGVCNGVGENNLGKILMAIRDFPRCTCTTKTPDKQYHADNCYYKLYAM